MAEFTYDSRKKISEKWIAQLKERGNLLSEAERKLLPSNTYQTVTFGDSKFIRELLEMGTYWNLSSLYKGQLSRLVDVCVSKELQDEFYYALDEMNQYQMTAGWYRRSMRSKSYVPFVQRSVQLLLAYSKLKFYDASLADILTGNVAPEIYDHARTEFWSYSGILAAQIDQGNQGTIQAVKDILLGEGNTAMISHELIRGIVMCKNKEMYQLLGDFLLAARLQEGARQAVCETMDAGRPEAFLHLFQVIEDNNLVRYSSVKRAVSTWIGIFDERSVDRITDKLMRLMGRCLREPEFAKEQLETNDSIAISCALWARGFYDAEEGVKAVLELIRNGTKNQKMTASYFNRTLQERRLKGAAAKEVILTYQDDLELVACYMPCFMENAQGCLRDLLLNEGTNYFSLRDHDASMPKAASPTSFDFFDSGEEAKKFYLCLRRIFTAIPKKGVDLNPCIFPWYRVTLSKSDVAVRMCLLAWMLQDEEYLDEAAMMIPLIGQGETYGASGRALAARVLLYRPRTQAKKDVLFELLHNPEEYALGSAFKLVEAMELTGDDYKKIEKNLKYKKGRAGTLSLLRKQNPAELRACIGRLLEEKSEECHMGALDLALQVKKERPEEFKEIRPLLSALQDPTGKEQILLGELAGKSSEAQDILNTPGYGFYDTTKKWVLPPVTVDSSGTEKLFAHGEKECIQLLKKLNAFIEKNQTLEYTTAWGEEKVLGTGLERCRWINSDPNATPLDAYPFRELWEKFYETEIKTPDMLMELYLYQACRHRRKDYENNLNIYRLVFGRREPFKDLVQGLRYGVQAGTVIDALFMEYVPQELKGRWALVVTAKLISVLDDSNDMYESEERYYRGTEIIRKRSAELPIFASMLTWLKNVPEEDWENSFALRFKIRERYSRASLENGPQIRGEALGSVFGQADIVQAYVRGIWDKDLFYKAIADFMGIGSLFGPISTVEQKGNVTSRNARVGELNAFFGPGKIVPVDGKYRFDTIGDEMPEMVLAHMLYKEIIPVVLKVELKRGEQSTPFSRRIMDIRMIYGIDTLIQILSALGNDPLDRSSYYYASRAESKKAVLSHLLKVCHPRPEETAGDLKKALKGTDITKKRLVEAAMYAPQWISMVEEYLKMPGLKSGCYYFMAHTSERMDEFTTSMVAKYTPLTPEELAGGAFDVNWFSEAYGKLGEKNFKLLYDAAKYSSSGTAHARARKYADAALGKVSLKELKAEIDAKRNKDLLMSIGLLPLDKSKKKKEEQLLERYQYIQKYKKESRNFGAQRRASEGRAVELALQNLSVNAGFTDVTRLTLRMESKLTESFGSYFEWQTLEGEISLKLFVDETGKSSLLCEKAGKSLKSIPAKYKKNEMVIQYQDANKKLKEQYSRTKQMMEQAMEDRTTFEVWELLELKNNPVVRPIIEPLVVRAANEGTPAAGKGQDDVSESPAHIGFLTESGLMDWSGTLTEIGADEKVYIAHPCDLYETGCWHEYQKALFDKKIRQPFRQIFRELYVKLSEELNKTESLMFAGNQIQPQKTVGALRSRRWVADYEDGLQKIYYKENIVARIYAMADWFSPSDVEAPTLEYVVFYDRKSFKPMKVAEVPDIIYSEVMRDVDLAVSVAHAGGVDPETSHSTIEMRRAIAECNLELFKIKNVTLEGNHAVIDGKLGRYTVHLGSGVVHQMGNSMLYVVPVHSQHRGRMFLPFLDDDPKTAEIMSKIILFAEDTKIKDPSILSQIR